MLKRGLKILLLAAAIVGTASLVMMAHPASSRAEDLSATPSISENIDAPAEDISSETASHEEAAGEESGEDIGFPQLKTDSYASQVFWLAVAFVALFGLMSKIALPKVGAILEHRKAQKSENIEQAEKMTNDAMKLKKSYETSLAKAQAKAHESLRSAEVTIKEKTAEKNAAFAEQSRKRLLATEQKIVKAKNDALESMADISAEIAAEMVHKIAGIAVNKADAKKIVSAQGAKD